MASALEDVEKELKGRSRKIINSRNQSGDKNLLSSANSKVAFSGHNQGTIQQSHEEDDEDSLNRPKQHELNREGAMMLMVMDSSASNHQDELVPEPVLVDIVSPGGIEELLSQPSLSTINNHPGIENRPGF